MQKGKFIVFEGPRGAGKSSHVDRIYRYMLDKNMKVKKTYEIGGTDFANDIRNTILQKNFDIDDNTNLLLILAARRNHIQKIKNDLEQGFTVLCDRFFYSTIVYQSLFDNIDKFLRLHKEFCYNLFPDKVIFLDCEDHILYDRVINRNRKKDNHDFQKKQMLQIIHNYRKVYRYFQQHPYFKEHINLVNVNQSIQKTQLKIMKLLYL